MAIATYSDLIVAATNWTAKPGIATRIPEFITLAQARINRQVRVLAMETKTTSITIDEEYESVPADFREVKNFYLTSSTPRRTLEYMAAELMTNDYTSTGTPRYFTVTGAQFRFAPIPSGSNTATLVYYAKPATLAATTQETNSLFPANADLYLYATLLEASGFLLEGLNQDQLPAMQAKIACWKAAYDEALAYINREAKNTHGSSLTTRLG